MSAMLPVSDVMQKVEGLGFDRLKHIPGSTFRDVSTVVVIPTRGMIHHKVVQAWQNLIAPMNQKRAIFFASGHEVGLAYDAMIERILADPHLSQWKYVLTLEDDNLPQPDAHIRLLESIAWGDYDAVSGIYFTKGDFNMPMAYGDPDHYARTGELEFRPRDIREALQRGSVMPVNGIAMGGGFELALACDLVIAAENAFFALSEPRVGLSALAGGVQYLPRAIGLPRAMGILLTGRRVPAKEGYELGFVTAVAPAGGAMEEARKWAAQMLECSPLALRATKEVARKTMLGEDFERKLVDAREFPAAKRLRTSNDYVEGPRAFAEKRKPNWTNT